MCVSHHKSGNAKTYLFTLFLRYLSGVVCFQNSNRIYVIFFPYFSYNSAVFYRTILQEKLHSFNIHDDRSTRFPCTTNYKNNIIKSNLYRELTIRWDCSVRSICHYVVRRVIMGFEQKRIYFNSIYKITGPSAKTYNASCRVFE